jgi:hypothetical protein
MLTSAKENILLQWKRHFDWISSDLNPKKLAERNNVNFIYNTLLDFWGEEHFNVNLLDLIHRDKHHFTIAALSKATASSFYYLFETATLIDRVKKENKEVYDKLYSVRFRTDTCREILFEIYTDWILSYNKIPYETGVWLDNQLKEGYCEIENTRYLIECKKKYSLGTQQLKIRQFITAEIFKIAQKIKIGLEFICVIHLKATELTQQQLSKDLKNFKNYIVNRGYENKLILLEYGTMSIEIMPFQEETAERLKDKIVPSDIFFVCKNTYEFVEDYLPYLLSELGGIILTEPQFKFRITVYFNVIINHDKIIKKLINSIHKAKSQHKTDNTPKIIIVDNEFVEDFTTPMLNGNIYYEEQLQQYVDQHTSNAIIVLLYRNFTQNLPSIKFSVICKEDQTDIKNMLNNIIFQPIDLKKLIFI